MPLKGAIQQLVAGESLSPATIGTVFDAIFAGDASAAQIAGLLVALRMKGETPEEIAGAATVMRRHATRIRTPAGRKVLDTCGTGGDGAATLNVSTAVAFVVAGAGVTVAKHGNRSVSSRCGSADVLRAAGVDIDAPALVVEACLEQIGIGFLYAPQLHGVMRYVIGPRRELGIRSLFNVLGPLINPAGASHQLVGVYEARLVPIVGATLARLGAVRALVVHGSEGLDEISPTGPTTAAFVEGGEVRVFEIVPADGGVVPVDPVAWRGGEPEGNARKLVALLEGETGAFREVVVLNAGAALWVAGLAANLRDGADLARQVLDDGRARQKLASLVALTNAPRTP